MRKSRWEGLAATRRQRIELFWSSALHLNRKTIMWKHVCVFITADAMAQRVARMLLTANEDDQIQAVFDIMDAVAGRLQPRVIRGTTMTFGVQTVIRALVLNGMICRRPNTYNGEAYDVAAQS